MPWTAGKLKFQTFNAVHYHSLLFTGWDDWRIGQNLYVISAVMPMAEQDIDLHNLVKKFNKHRHLLYFWGRTRNCQCQFGYYTNVINPDTSIEQTFNRVVYRRSKEQGVKVVPYDADVMDNYRCNINVGRTQGGGAVTYFMKCAFKLPSMTDVEFEDASGSNQTSTNLALDSIRNEIPFFMRAWATDSVEAA